MGLMLPDILLIDFLLPRATAPHFFENTSLVAGLTLPLADIETFTVLSTLPPCFMVFILCRIPRKWLEPNFFKPSPVAGLPLPLVDNETFTVLSTSTLMLHDHHFVYRERDIPPIFTNLPLVTGLTLPLVDTETSHHYFFDAQ